MENFSPILRFAEIFLFWPSHEEKKIFSKIVDILWKFFYISIYSGLAYFTYLTIGDIFYDNHSNTLRIVDELITFAAIIMFYFFHFYNVFNRTNINFIISDILSLEKVFKIFEKSKFCKEICMVFLVATSYIFIEYKVFMYSVDNYTISYSLCFSIAIVIVFYNFYVAFNILRYYKIIFMNINYSIDQIFKISPEFFASLFQNATFYDKLLKLTSLHFALVNKIRFFNSNFAPLISFFTGYIFAISVVYINYPLKIIAVYLKHNTSNEGGIVLAAYNFTWVMFVDFCFIMVVSHWVIISNEVSLQLLKFSRI